MALPLLAIAAAAKILGPQALKSAKFAYRMYKKKGGTKTEQKFISDKANQVLKTDIKQIKSATTTELKRQGKDKGQIKTLLKNTKKKVKDYYLKEFEE